MAFSYIFQMDILCVLSAASAGGVHNKTDDRCVVFVVWIFFKVTRTGGDFVKETILIMKLSTLLVNSNGRYKVCFVMRY